MVIDWENMVFISPMKVCNFGFQRMSTKIKGQVVLSVNGVEVHLD
jgi:hypothetical protein